MDSLKRMVTSVDKTDVDRRTGNLIFLKQYRYNNVCIESLSSRSNGNTKIYRYQCKKKNAVTPIII